MATAYEIQVTEAYIGLLGRAPDPAGLAYWVAQLDAAVAAGQDATLALKKLTNDIANSTEFTTGTIGTQVPASGNPSQAQADSIVTSLYNNLFERAPTAADLTYWTAQLTGGSTTAPEMTLNLITAAKANAKTTDADVLGYKQEAATYYVEKVPQASFTKGSATDSVKDVSGPITLSDSKTATDYVVSGVGESFSLTVATNDALVGTAGSDTFTGTAGTGATTQATDSITDTSSSDADVLNITGDEEFDMPTVTGVETINVSIGKQLGAGLDLDAANLTGGTLNYTVSENVTIAGVSVPGETVLTADNMSSDLNTVNVTSLTVGLDGEAVTISTDNDATAVSITGVNANDTTLIVGNDSASTINITGVDATATNDAATITANGNVSLVVDGGVAANDVEILTLSGGTNDVTFTVTGVTTVANMDYITTGSKAVTLTGAAGMFSGATFVQGATTGLDITADGALDLTGQGVFAGGIDVSVNLAATQTITLQSGNTVTASTTQDAADALTFVAANDTTADTLAIVVSNDVGELVTTNFETVTIATGDFAATFDEISMSDNNADLSIAGTNDITFTTDVDAGSLAVSGNDVNLGAAAISSTKGAIDLDAIDTLTVQAGLSANNGLTIDADEYTVTGAIAVTNGNAVLTGANDSDVDAVTISAGSLTMSGNDIAIGGAVAAQNDVTITASQIITAGANAVNTTGAGGSNAISISANDSIATIGAIGSATTKTITISAGNDTAVSNLDGNVTTAVTSGASVTLSDGNFALGGIAITTNALLITGDTDISAAPATIDAESITITSTNDVALGTVSEATALEGVVVSGGGATGAISATFNGDGASGNLNVVTGSGNDTLVLNEVGKFIVNTGDGVDNVTITDAAAASTIQMGGGADVIDNDEIVAIVINAGAGNDSYVGVAADTSTVDMGADFDTITLSAAKTGNGTIVNFEKLVLGGNATISDVQFAADNTFQVTGANALTVTGAAATAGTTIDASGVTFDVGAVSTMTLTGSGFDDTITGSLTNDTIDGGNGNDTITVTEGVNSLTGGAGNDTITGGNDPDTIIGGTGVDTINGGAGNDSHSFTTINAAANRDVVNGFVVGTDHVGLSAALTTDGTLANAQAVYELEAVAAANANNTVYDLDAALAATTKTVDVAALSTTVLTNLANADLTAATDGSELLKALVAVGAGNTASGINANANGDALYIATDDGVNGYLYLATDTSTNGAFEASEIVLIATFNGAATFGDAAVTSFVMVA